MICFLWNSGQIASVEGAKLIKEENGETRIRVELPGTDFFFLCAWKDSDQF